MREPRARAASRASTDVREQRGQCLREDNTATATREKPAQEARQAKVENEGASAAEAFPGLCAAAVFLPVGNPVARKARQTEEHATERTKGKLIVPD